MCDNVKEHDLFALSDFTYKKDISFHFTFHLQLQILAYILHLHLCSSFSSYILSHFTTNPLKMARPHEANPVLKKPFPSKKHKPKSGKSSLKHSGKSGHREEHRNEHQEHHEVSGQNTPGQDKNIQGQPETSGRVAEQLVVSKQEKLDKKRKSIPKEEAAAIKSAGNTKGRASFRLGTMNRIENHLPL